MAVAERVTGLISTGSAFAQDPSRDSSRHHGHRDSTRQHRNWDSTKNNSRWDRNTARSNEDIAYTYIDLNTGDTLDYFYDTEKKTVMNRTSNSPVDFYVNT